MIQKQHSRFTLGLTACLTLLPLSSALAQDRDRWFLVELLVFSNELVNTTEQWEPTPALAYPNASRFLVEPQRVQANKSEHPGSDSRVDEFGRQFLTILPEPGEVSDAVVPDIPRPATGDTAAMAPGNPVEVPVAVGGQNLASQPTPFTTLPSGHREFRGKAAYMQRSGRYRTLFHQTWAQPVRDQANALPVVLDRSGDTGQWPRLQGSVKLYLSRYLHIETNLWLNTSGDYLPGVWRMPAAPLGPPSLIIEDLSLPALEDAALEWQGMEEESQVVLDPNDATPQDEEESGPVYPYRHAVLLQQKRRMRSTEVHYIDHPLFGVVVKLTPLSDEDLQILAAAEAESGPVDAQAR